MSGISKVVRTLGYSPREGLSLHHYSPLFPLFLPLPGTILRTSDGQERHFEQFLQKGVKRWKACPKGVHQQWNALPPSTRVGYLHLSTYPVGYLHPSTYPGGVCAPFHQPGWCMCSLSSTRVVTVHLRTYPGGDSTTQGIPGWYMGTLPSTRVVYRHPTINPGGNSATQAIPGW